MKITSIFILCICMIGCATSSVNDYKDLQKRFSLEKSADISNSLNNTSAIKIQTNKLEHISILKNDSIAKLNDGISYYKVMSFKADAGKSYKVDLWSLCDCFGFSKTMVDPDFEIYGSNGLQITSKFISSTFEDVNWSIKRPLSLHNIYEFQSAENQNIFLILASDNTAVGRSLTTRHPVAYGSGLIIPLVVNIFANPLGNLEFNIAQM